ncbi:hypothetical protein B0T19DRAFT_409129 [Cercophora scortea]|uniref:Uncharacterized protein n=1 Tax=Cercophora scortea TaxID=314031 RepID=A0AAE0MKY8_9PEZI|nr:hypothetical protein B0T19DRAFT_409129 [Cercophora scortea]
METPPTPARQLYLACFIPSRLFTAHWAMWVPSTDDEHIGTLIQVIGDPLNGFVHEFERGYRPQEDSRPPLLLELGGAGENSVVPDGPMIPGRDANAYNELERLALSIPAPTPSLKPAAAASVSQTKPRITIDNCQSWLSRLINAMVAQHMIDDGARGVLQTAPKN